MCCSISDSTHFLSKEFVEMKYLLITLFIILMYEAINFFYKETYKNWRTKYFCGKLSEEIALLHPFKERVFYDKFSVFVGHTNEYAITLDNLTIATWKYLNGKVTDVIVNNEELFKTFKENYILENN